MKRIKRWLLVSLLLLFLLSGGIIWSMLHPSCFYTYATSYKQIVILHNQALDEQLFPIIDSSLTTLENSELYDSSLVFYWCLKDGSFYPDFIEGLLGPDTFRAFSNIIVAQSPFHSSTTNFKAFEQTLSTQQFLTHAMVHNLQFAHHGIWDANPLGGHPEWKWEGYAEYLSILQKPERETIQTLIAEEREPYSWVSLGSGQMTIYLHTLFLGATMYCMEVKGMNYETFMKDTTSFEEVLEEIFLSYE